MAKITRQDLIDDDALMAPLVLAENYTKSIQEAKNLIESAKQYSDAMNTQSDSATKFAKATGELTAEQEALNKIQTQIANEVTKQSEAYQEQVAVLKQLKDAYKDKTVLGEKDAQQVNAQNSSVEQLAYALRKNRQEYAQLSNEQSRNSQQGRALLQVIQQQSKDLDTLNLAQGKVVLKASAFREETEKAIPVLQKFAPEALEAKEKVEGLASKLTAVASSPVVAGLLLIGGLFAALKKGVDLYTEGTVAGADQAARFTVAWDTALGIVKAKLRDIGGEIVKWFGSSGTGDFLGAAIAGLTSVVTADTGVILKYYKNLEINNQIISDQLKLRKEEIENNVKLTDLELEKEQELFTARDKAGHNLEERYEALIKANSIIKEEIALKTKSAQLELEIQQLELKKKGIVVSSAEQAVELLTDKNAIEKVGYEQIEKIVGAYNKLVNIQKEEFAGARRRQALQASLTDEEIKLITERSKAEFEARVKTDDESLKYNIKTNEQFLEQTGRELDEKEALLKENLDSEFQLNQNAKDQAIFAEREKFRAIVELTSKDYEQIDKLAGDSVVERAKLELAMKDAIIAQDESFKTKVNEITHQQLLNDSEAYAAYYKKLIDLRNKFAQDQGSIRSAGNAVDTSYELVRLNQTLANKELSVRKYELFKQNIELASAATELQIQADTLVKELQNYESATDAEVRYAKEIAEKKRQIAENEYRQSELINRKRVELEKQTRDLRIQLAETTISSLESIEAGLFESQLATIEARRTALEEQYQADVQNAGNNAEAKIYLERSHTAELKKLQEEELRIKQKAAIFDKAAAVLDITLKTAQAVAQIQLNATALASNPFTAPLALVAEAMVPLAIGIGAAQIAAVLAKPLPQYAEGTNYHKGGKAIIGERGSELVEYAGNFMLSPDKATIVDLPKGARVYTHEETLYRLATSAISMDSLGTRSDAVVRNSPAMSKEPKINFVEAGTTLMKVVDNGKGMTKRIRAYALGDWVI